MVPRKVDIGAREDDAIEQRASALLRFEAIQIFPDVMGMQRHEPPGEWRRLW